MFRVALVLVLVPTMLVGCSSSMDMMKQCTAVGTLAITVSDDEKGAPICDATVTVTPPGGMPMPLMASDMGPNCAYRMNVTPGSYQVSIAKTGFGSAGSSVVVTTVDCVVASPTLSFPLTRK